MILQVKNIEKSFGKNIILKDVSMTCQKGEILGIFGRNGTGKSSLMKIIFGILKHDKGTIEIDQKSYYQNEIIPNQEISYLPQDTFLPKNIKVRNIIPFFFQDGCDQDKIFYSKGVGNFTQRKIKELSLGQLRYLEILLIGHLNHSYMLLDEPFSMIEPIYKDFIKELLLKLKNQKGIILTDHYYSDVLEISDKNYLIKDGSILKIQNKNDLIKSEYLNKK